MSVFHPSSPNVPVLFEIQEALLSTLYPIKNRWLNPQNIWCFNWGPCCNCQTVDLSYAPVVFWIEENLSWDSRTRQYNLDWRPAWVGLNCYYGHRLEPYHYFSDPLCQACAYAVKHFIQDNIIASYSITLNQFDSICTEFPHELNRIIFHYTNPLLR